MSCYYIGEVIISSVCKNLLRKKLHQVKIKCIFYVAYGSLSITVTGAAGIWNTGCDYRPSVLSTSFCPHVLFVISKNYTQIKVV